MFCKNCGKELPDGIKFCSGCGTPVTPAEPAVNPDPVMIPPTEAATPIPDSSPIPGSTSIPNTPPVTPDPAGGETSGGALDALANRKGKSKTGLIVLGAGAVVLIVVVVLLVKLLGGLLGGGGSAKSAYVYLTDDYELMYRADLNENTKAVEITDKDVHSGANVQFSPDGKYVYYLDASNSLYVATVADLSKDTGKPDRISRGVNSFTVLKDGRVLYTESSEANVYDGKESFRVVKGFNGWQLDDDQKNLYYTELSSRNNTYTLYKIALTKDAKEEKLLDGADRIYTKWSSSVLVYGEDSSSRSGSSGAGSSGTPSRKGNNTLTIYSCKPGGEPTELVEDILQVPDVKVDGDKVSFYYIVENTEEHTLYDFVTDSQAGADTALLAEELTRPSSSNYYPNAVYMSEGSWYYDDYRGQTYLIDSATLVARYEMALEEIPQSYVRNVAVEMGRALYDIDREAYETKYQQRREAQQRENVRKSLKETTYNQTSYSLFLYNNGASSDAIATGVGTLSSGFGDAENGVFVYKKAPSLSGGKVADVSELDYASQIYDRLKSGASDDDWYQNVGGRESTLDKVDPQANVQNGTVLNGNEVVLYVYEDGEPSLMSFTLGKDALTFSTTIIDGQFSMRVSKDSSDKDVIYLFTDMENTSSSRTMADLSIYTGGGNKPETIAKEIFGVYILENGATYLVTDIDNQGGLELSVLQDGKPARICKEVDRMCAFIGKDQLLYISDGDLTLYDGKAERRIAKGVIVCWASTSEPIQTVLFP